MAYVSAIVTAISMATFVGIVW
ncbi:CcoQ/FixQ family Cbb3-type cytochrome c oxidase assembly chaperone, partial [Macrococcoides goetzii]